LIDNELLLWVAFGIMVLALLALDLGVFHRKSHEISIKEALLWSAFWIFIAFIFNVAIYKCLGSDSAVEFAAAYLIERALSFDNLFIFLLVLSYFKVPSRYQYRVLFWGIVAALLFRGIFIMAGIELIDKFHWVLYIFGAFLIFTGIRIFMQKDGKEMDLEGNPVLRLSRRLLPCTDEYHGGSFFTKIGGKTLVTPLFIVLLVIETSDLLFAIDSVPAVFGITLDPFIVYTSNIFAILGLRALYFALAGCMLAFRYLSHGITIILIFIGLKMLLTSVYEIPPAIALGIIIAVLVISILLSMARPAKPECS
jgi:tellurite resistance protein TerC